MPYGVPQRTSRYLRNISGSLAIFAAIRRASSVSGGAFLVFIRNYLRWSRRRVQIAKAAITGEYVT
jgi:hypothetical protein